jgi:3-oxoacyl-[acyl-carrier protein] reductase
LESEAQAQDVVQEIKRLGSKAIAVRADVSQGDEVKALVSAALETFGCVDILVNNAAIYLPYSFFAAEGLLHLLHGPA